MSSSPPSQARSRSVLTELYSGRVRWDLLRPFPEPDAADERNADRAVAQLTGLLRALVDPTEVDVSGRLPEGPMKALQDNGFLKLMITEELGGLGLSAHGAFRVIEAAASWSAPVAFSLAITNGFGSGSYLPALPEGPLKDLISARVADGLVSAGADAEAQGTANQTRTTRAIAVEDGAAYRVSGEKVFIGNGPVAGLMDVSATVTRPDGTEAVDLFFVDSASPGFEVAAEHEFMGLRGALIGALRLDNVRVPAEYRLGDPSNSWRMRPDTTGPESTVDGLADLGELAVLGRILVIAPNALAIAKLCLLWSREFANRRRIDNRGLGEYDEIQRLIAQTAADVFAIDSIASWALLAHDRADTVPDLTAAKNLTSMTCWRVVDRTMSLLGAEGYETAVSKARRGAVPLPVERSFRDARALRIAGGVDFMLDKWSAESTLSTLYATDVIGPAGTDDISDGALSPRCREHLDFVVESSATLARTCARLIAEHTRAELFEHQHAMTVIGRIGNELFGMSVVLARAAQLATAGTTNALELADISCAGSRLRIGALWPELAATEPDFAAASDGWLRGNRFDFLIRDIVTEPATKQEEANTHA